MIHVQVIESAIMSVRLIAMGVIRRYRDFEIKECNFGYLS